MLPPESQSLGSNFQRCSSKVKRTLSEKDDGQKLSVFLSGREKLTLTCESKVVISGRSCQKVAFSTNVSVEFESMPNLRLDCE